MGAVNVHPSNAPCPWANKGLFERNSEQDDVKPETSLRMLQARL